MRIKCPSCYAEFDLVAALDSDAGRELVLLFAAQPREISAPLAVYLSLFRSATRALSWDRALKLATEVIALAPDAATLARSLSKTVDVLREKQAQGGWKPLTNHNYFKQVMQGVAAAPAPAAVHPVQIGRDIPAVRLTATEQALAELDALIYD